MYWWRWHSIGWYSFSLKPLSQWEVSSGDIELTRCNATVKAICVGLASSANYPDQWSDATIIRCKLHCERVKLFVSLLGGAAYAAVSRDFRSVLHVSIREFMVVNRACFQTQGFIFRLRLYFKWAISISGFAAMTSRANNIRSRCATTWLQTSPSGGYSAAPLPSSPERGLTSHCESDKLSLLSLVRMTLTRNNHCERGL